MDDQTAPPNGHDAGPSDDQGAAAAPGYASPPPGYGQYPYQPQAQGYGRYPRQDPPRHRGLPWWAIVLIVVAVLPPVAAIGSAIAIPVFLNQHDKANDSAVREGVHSIQVGIQSYAVDNNDAYPSPDEVTPHGAVGRYVGPWPVNPGTGEPMRNSTARGDFTYAVAGDGTYVDYTRSGNLSDGTLFTVR